MEIITAHNNVDFDGLASMVAAHQLYPEALILLPSHVNPNVKAFLSIHKDLFDFKGPRDIDPDSVKRLIVVDTNRWGRLDGLEKLRQRDDVEILLWDHHPQEGNIAADWACQEKKGANITLLLRVLREKGVELSEILATLFLAGIYEDTGNLSFPSSTSEDAFAAGYLLENKADLNVINTFLRPAYGEKQKNVLFEMLQNPERIKLDGYTVSFNKVEIVGHVDRLSIVVHMYREILNVDAAFGIFKDHRDRCMVIGRSNIDGINVGSIMRSMGGGGHPGAGSAMLKVINPDAVVDWIRELIVGNQQSSIRISDLMSFPVFTASAETSMRQVSVLLDEKGCTGLPVLDDDRLVGVISRRDFNKVKKQSQLDQTVKGFMARDIKTIEPWRSPMQAARLMVKYDIGRLPVIDEDGQLLGIITRSDAMTYLYDLIPD